MEDANQLFDEYQHQRVPEITDEEFENYVKNILPHIRPTYYMNNIQWIHDARIILRNDAPEASTQ